MDVERLAQLASQHISDGSRQEVQAIRPLPGLLLLQHRRPTTLEATLYEPVVCLILRGRKETTLGERTVAFGPGQSLLVSHDLPVVSRITDASPEAPYLALILALDLGILRGLYEDIAGTDLDSPDARSLEVQEADPLLIDAFGRLLDIARRPLEAGVLAPLVLREIHFRLLTAPTGGMLRRLLLHDSHATHIARAIVQIRRDFRSRIAIPELAKATGMSPSAFHKHFKDITATTPLQYQKELRLLEARRLLSVEGRSVSAAAFEVGYESPTQFSREYSRKFGVPPSSDVAGRSAHA